MKKRLLTAIAVSFCIGSYAQTGKGKIILGGSVGFNSNKVNSQATQKATSFNLGPSIGFFTSENIAIGIDLAYDYQKRNPYSQTVTIDNTDYISGASGNKSESIRVSPFLRAYLDLHEKVKLFGQLNAGIQFGRGRIIDVIPTPDQKNKTTTYLASLEPGIAFFPNKKIAIELKVPLVNYFNQKTKYDNSTAEDLTYSNLTVGSNLNSPVLGINFHF